MRRCWPDPSTEELTEADLVAAYQVADRSQPHVRVNFVTSLDGAVTVDGRSAGLSSVADRQLLARLRMLADVLLVGAGTVRTENYNPLRLTQEGQDWRRANGLPDNPVLAVVSNRLDLSPDLRAFADAPVRPLVITHDAAPRDRRQALAEVADVLVCGEGEVRMGEVAAALMKRGLPQILCEGGPQVFGTLLASDLVDELCLTVTPLLTGSGAGRIIAGPTIAAPRRLRPVQLLQDDDGTLFMRYGRPL
jgi:riboflavin-specific deaminase-like protein